jgi:hypothetical protein
LAMALIHALCGSRFLKDMIITRNFHLLKTSIYCDES